MLEKKNQCQLLLPQKLHFCCSESIVIQQRASELKEISTLIHFSSIMFKTNKKSQQNPLFSQPWIITERYHLSLINIHLDSFSTKTGHQHLKFQETSSETFRACHIFQFPDSKGRGEGRESQRFLAITIAHISGSTLATVKSLSWKHLVSVKLNH